MQDLTPRTIDLESIELAPVDEIREVQLERMKWSLKHSYENSPFYREQFDQAGVHPDDLKELSDLGKFPFTEKKHLRDTYPFGMFAVPRNQVLRIHGSSGTTGKPIVVGYTRNDLDNWANVVARSIRAAGGRKGMMVHNAYGYGLFTGGLGLHAGAERLGCTVVPMSGGQTERQIQLITDFEPDIIVVTPSYMMTILDEMERHGIDPRKTSLKVGIFGAEPWTDEMRKEMEQKLDMHAIDIYGLTEVVGPGVASECVETKDGLTIWEDHFYPEIIDPETGEALPDGGERIVHRMGDLGYFDAEGRLWFCGRKSQRVVTGGAGTLCTEQVEPVFNAHPEVARTALVGVGERGSQRPVLCVELTPGVAKDQHARIVAELRHIGEGHVHTAKVETFLFHPGFPVDIRHNAKIGREKLAAWARTRLKRSPDGDGVAQKEGAA